MSGWWSGVRRPVRLVLVGLRTHLTFLASSWISIAILLLTPVVYVLVGAYLYQAGGRADDVVSVAVAAGVIGIWGAVLSNSGTAVHRQRYMGTLELMMISPAPLPLVLASIVLAPMLIGMASMAVALGCAAVLFHVTVPASVAPAFVLSVLLCALAVATMGLIMAASFILFRNPYAVVNAIEIPVWMLSGVMLPLSILPGWAQSVAAVLPSRWGVELLDDTVTGRPMLTAALATTGVAAAYVLASAAIIRYVAKRSRVHGRLTFA